MPKTKTPNCLLARDTPLNRQLFPNGPFGHVDITGDECADDGTCPYYHYRQDQTPARARETPIHVLIASYRDKLCGRTLHNAFEHAENPHRLWIRVYDQILEDSELEDDQGCWERYCSIYNAQCEEYKDQVQIIPVDASLSKGPTDARSKLSALIHWDYTQTSSVELHEVAVDDFCMQIDSHMDFSDHFDTRLVNMFHRTQNDYAVLSTYVTAMEENNKNLTNVPLLCQVQFTSSIRNWGTKECNHLVKPKMTNAMWGAGLSFHRCHGELNVPVDPYLDGVFDGEEGSRGIRFFTHGYDVYTPDEVLVTHDYHGHQSNPVVHTWGRAKNNNRKHRKQQEEDEEQGHVLQAPDWRWYQDIQQDRKELSIFGSKRVNMLLGIGSTFDATDREREELVKIRESRFGLGTKRNLEQVAEHTGIDLLQEKMMKNQCGNLKWVKYEESPTNYGVDEILSRGNVGGLLPQQKQHDAKVVIDQHHRDFRPTTDAKGNNKSAFLRMAAAASSQGQQQPNWTKGVLIVIFILLLLKLVWTWKHKNQKHPHKKN